MRKTVLGEGDSYAPSICLDATHRSRGAVVEGSGMRPAPRDDRRTDSVPRGDGREVIILEVCLFV